MKSILLGKSEASIYYTAGIHTTSSINDKNSVELAIKQSMTNLIPHTSLIKILSELKIKVKILVACSLSSVIGLPFQQYYSASKSATQFFYESISYELKRSFCTVYLIRLGSVNTGFNSKGNLSPMQNSYIYDDYLRSLNKINGKKQLDPKKVAKYFVNLTKKKSGYGTYLIDYGLNSFLLSFFRRIFGFRITSYLASKYLVR